jgi:hypothetical protein
MPTTNLRVVRERLARLAGPNREADAAIALDLDNWRCRFDQGYRHWSGGPHDASWTREGADYPPSYTESVDVALALVARLLPKWSIRMSLSEGYRYPVVTMGRSYPTNATVAMEHHTLPLAILAALVAAIGLGEADPTA